MANIIPWNDNINLDKETILLIFSATWCPPCKALIPVLDKVNGMISNNQFKICKIDCEEHQKISEQFNIRSVPTIILVHKGKSTVYNQTRDANTIYQWVINHI